MKYIYIIILLFLISRIHAEQVDSTLAKEIAINLMKFKAPEKTFYNTLPVIERKFENITTSYLINFESKGFVIVAADDRTVPVLAYSVNSSVNAEDIPPGALFFLNYYDKSIFKIITENSLLNNNRYKWDLILNNKFSNKQKSVDPLITTRWNQTFSFGYPYNCHAFNFYVTETSNDCNDCGSDNHCAAGCVAVAAAQIMRYWAHPVRPDNKYKWCEMVDTLRFSSPDYETERNAIARLIRDFGVEVNMKYCHGKGCGSGASDLKARNKLVNSFGYDNSANLRRRFMHTDKKWKELLRKDLDKGMPVYYSGQDEDGGGHAFICDGYGHDNDDDNFHFNFGWNGGSDGNYYIDNIDTNNGNYNNWQQIITDIKPDYNYDCNGEINVEQYYKLLPQFHSLYYYPMYGTIYSTLSEDQIIIESSDDNVLYTAHNSIRLKNFRVKSGATFRAQIIQCPSDCAHSSKDAGKETTEEDNSKQTSTNNNDEFCIEESNILLYPNPAKQTVTIEIKISEDEKCNCTITDISGKEYYSQQFDLNNNYFKKEINLSTFPAGIYFINFKSNTVFETKKLIIQK